MRTALWAKSIKARACEGSRTQSGTTSGSPDGGTQSQTKFSSGLQFNLFPLWDLDYLDHLSLLFFPISHFGIEMSVLCQSHHYILETCNLV